MTIKATEGNVTIGIDDTEIRELADRITQGAVTTFLTAARRQMDPTVAEGRSLWPTDTGATAAGLHILDRVTPEKVSVTAYGATKKTYMQKFSRRTEDNIRAEAQAFATALWPRLSHYTDRGTDTGAKIRIAHWFLRNAGSSPPASARSRAQWTREGGAWPDLSGGDLRGWYSNTPVTAESVRRERLGRLFSHHGKGAPTETLAARNVWSAVIRAPARKRQKLVIAEARDALDKLAKG